MKVAVISDSHDHLEHIDRAVTEATRQGADMLIHCGDLCSPFTMEHLANFKGPVHVVFGNNEGDRFTIERVSQGFEHVTIHGEFAFLETAEGDIAVTHRPEFARGFAHTGSYTAVFYGHTHQYRSEQVGGTRLVNPGELMGLVEHPGWVIFDLQRGTEERIEL
jgi:putative phosphoesterase